MGIERKLATIVAVDVVGYSALTENDETQATTQIALLRRSIEEVAAEKGGRLFSSAGDGFMLEFGSSTAAVEAALRIAAESKPQVRVGVHLGDVAVQPNGDLLGHGVNVAARLMALAAPGGTAISTDVRRTMRGARAAGFVSRGPVRLEKMSETVEVFDWAGQGKRARPLLPPRWRLPALSAIAFAVIATLAFFAVRLAAPPAEHVTVAVLPFSDLSAGRTQEYFADGISEEILNALARVEGLRVTGRTSSFSFKDRNEDVRTIGRALGVAHLIEGSVRREGDRVRVTAQLVRTRDGVNVWSQGYDRELTDILAVQQEIASAIARELRTSLTEDTFEAGAAITTSAEAYDAYLRGRSLFWTRSSVTQAAAQFERAVELDPEFAAAWAALADVYVALPAWVDQYEGEEPDVAVYQRRAERAAQRALEINPNLAATHHALSVVYRDRWQWSLAEDAIRRAIQLEPNASYVWEDQQEFLENVGRWEESAEAIETAIEIDPLNPFYHAIAGIAYWHLRDYDRAAESMRRALRMNSSLQSFHVEYVALLVDAGRMDDAVAYLETCVACDTRSAAFMRRAMEYARAPSGSFAYGRELESTFGDYVFRGLVGGDELVLARLEEATAAGELVPLSINNRAIAGVRESERYMALIRATGLDDYWREKGWPSFCRPVGAHDFRCTS